MKGTVVSFHTLFFLPIFPIYLYDVSHQMRATIYSKCRFFGYLDGGDTIFSFPSCCGPTWMSEHHSLVVMKLLFRSLFIRLCSHTLNLPQRKEEVVITETDTNSVTRSQYDAALHIQNMRLFNLMPV